MALSLEEVKKIAQLARIELSESELAKYSEQLSSVLEYVSQLKEVSEGDANYDYAVEGLYNSTDEDKVRPTDGASRQIILDDMPDKVGDLLKVKPIF